MSESMALHFSLPPAYRASAICGRARRFRCSSFFLSFSFLPPLLGLVCWLSFLFSRSLALQSACGLALRRRLGASCLLEASRGQLQPPLLLLFFFLSFLPFFSFFLHLGRRKKKFYPDPTRSTMRWSAVVVGTAPAVTTLSAIWCITLLWLQISTPSWKNLVCCLLGRSKVLYTYSISIL